MKRFLLVLHPLCLVALCVPACSRDKARAPGVVSTGPGATTVLATIPDDAAPPTIPLPARGPHPNAPAGYLEFIFGERGGGVAFVSEREGTLQVVHNGRAGKRYEVVGDMILSADGLRCAYAALAGGKWRVVVDGVEGPAFSTVNLPVFSPDGRHVAYVAGVGETRRVVVDGVEGPRCLESIGVPTFSADSTFVAYAEDPGDGRPARLVVSDLSLSRASVKSSGVKAFIANDARRSIAAVVEDGDGERVVVADLSIPGAVTSGRPYDAVSDLTFVSGSATVAYVAEKAGRRLLVLGEREDALPDGAVVGTPVIRPGGAGVGVILSSTGGQFLHESFVAGRARQGRRYEEAAELVYAAGGGASAFCARRGEAWFVVVNGEEGPPFDRVVSPTFSPDGGRLVYRARKDGRRFVVVADANGRTLRQLPAYEQVFPVRFTADGRSIAYGVKDGRQLAWKIEPL